MPSIRVATWNIHGSIGRDRKASPERTAAIVQSFGADVVVLQEVDGREHLGRRGEAFETYAELLGGHVVEARLFGKPGREHGNLLWSRTAPTRSTVHLLPGGMEQRGLIEAELSVDGSGLRILGTHFGLFPSTRRQQACAALEAVGRGAGPVLLMGDLNEWKRAGAVHRALRERLPVDLRPPTFPARRPVVALDRIYASAGIDLQPIASPPEAAVASDHRPIVADVSWEHETPT